MAAIRWGHAHFLRDETDVAPGPAGNADRGDPERGWTLSSSCLRQTSGSGNDSVLWRDQLLSQYGGTLYFLDEVFPMVKSAAA